MTLAACCTGACQAQTIPQPPYTPPPPSMHPAVAAAAGGCVPQVANPPADTVTVCNGLAVLFANKTSSCLTAPQRGACASAPLRRSCHDCGCCCGGCGGSCGGGLYMPSRPGRMTVTKCGLYLSLWSIATAVVGSTMTRPAPLDHNVRRSNFCSTGTPGGGGTSAAMCILLAAAAAWPPRPVVAPEWGSGAFAFMPGKHRAIPAADKGSGRDWQVYERPFPQSQ
jgi:hypothetical protein